VEECARLAASYEPPLCWQPSQQRAFGVVLQSREVAVQGPPGAGKTHMLALTLLRILEASGNLKRKGCIKDSEALSRMLVVAPTNEALDNARERLELLLRLRGEQDPSSHDALGKVEIVSLKTRYNFPRGSSFVLFSTIFQLQKQVLQERDPKPYFDLVAMDETSQMLPIDVLTALHFWSGNKMVMFGDLEQLGPIVKGGEAEWPEKDGLRLHESLLDAMTKRGAVHVQLEESIRCNQALSHLISVCYSAPLQAVHHTLGRYLRPTPAVLRAARSTLDADAGRTLKEGLVDALCGEVPCATLLVVLRGKISSYADGLQKEASVVGTLATTLSDALAVQLAESPDAAGGTGTPPQLFVVVPHRAQIMAVTQMLCELRDGEVKTEGNGRIVSENETSRICVGTVNVTQGRECEVVVAAYGFDDNKLRSEVDFLADHRRLHVAVSRARRLAVLVCREDLLEPPTNLVAGLQNKFFNYVRRFATFAGGSGNEGERWGPTHRITLDV